MPVKPEDVHKIAFKIRGGVGWGGVGGCLEGLRVALWVFRMPFGVTNTPTQFMNMKNHPLNEYVD